MITKVTIQPYITITDPSWIKLWQHVQAHPFSEMKIKFKEGKPFEAMDVQESIRF